MKTRILLFLSILAFLAAGCSTTRIVKYTTYEKAELNGRKPAILFVNRNFYIHIDGSSERFIPFFAGAYGGRHIYLTPGEHEITCAYTYESETVTTYSIKTYRNPVPITFNAKENMYYKLIGNSGEPVRIEEMKMPERLPTSTSKIY